MRMDPICRWTFAVFLLAAMATVSSAEEIQENPSTDRGGMLYVNHCLVCHDSVVHLRMDRRARSIEEVAQQVRRWSEVQSLQWSDEDVDEVSDYLERRFYRFGEGKARLPPSAGATGRRPSTTSGVVQAAISSAISRDVAAPGPAASR